LDYLNQIIKKNNNNTGISPQYASPEVFNSVRLKTPLDLKGYQSGDLFSFGVVVWEIINRQIPWSDSPLEEIEYSIRFAFLFLFLFENIKTKKIEKCK